MDKFVRLWRDTFEKAERVAERIPFSYLKGLRVLAIAEEEDILKTIENVLTESQVDRAKDYADALQKLGKSKYGLALLGINGVNGIDLMLESVNRGIPTVMLNTHATNPETLQTSITRGGVSYLPREELPRLREFLDEFLATFKNAGPKQVLEGKRNIFGKLFGQYWIPDEADYWARYFQ